MAGYTIPQTRVNAAEATFPVDPATGLPVGVAGRPEFTTLAGGGARNFFADVSYGLHGLNYRPLSVFGNNPDTTAPEDIWSLGGNYPWMTAATSLEVVSSSASDSSAGTGARTISISGLNAAFVEVVQTITMNGITPVAVPTQLYRINSVSALTAGSNGTNVGAITVRDAGGGTTRGNIPAGYGTSRQSQFTVPLGYSMIVEQVLLSINRPSSARDATIASYAKPDGAAFRHALEMSVDGNPFNQPIIVSVALPEKTDFGLRCMYTSSPNTDITAAWFGVLKANAAT